MLRGNWAVLKGKSDLNELDSYPEHVLNLCQRSKGINKNKKGKRAEPTQDESINIEKERRRLAVPENHYEITKNDEVPTNPIEAHSNIQHVGAHNNSVRASNEKEKLPITISVAERRDVVALDLTKSDKAPKIQTEANVDAESTPIRISIDNQMLKITDQAKAYHIQEEVEDISWWWDDRDLISSTDNEKLKITDQAKGDHTLEEVEKAKMFWDSRDLRIENRHIEDELEDNSFNMENEDHACFKDIKIIEVSFN